MLDVCRRRLDVVNVWEFARSVSHLLKALDTLRAIKDRHRKPI